ncbi:MAG TPA: T9SS type A sorting domain-containing protein, partial [Bacteroidetes bacterium]|nr:T9SS type A sorting domain-containing protein [Bacteroidota bacterium]
CGSGRYISEIFNDFTLTSDVTFGSNINLQNQTQSLELDIYEPMGDTEPLRPVLVMQHGGSFIGGSKTGDDITTLAEPLARMGYVVVSAEYRLGMEGLPFPGPDSSEASESVWRAVADFKAAVRFMYKSAATGNPYRIDTNRLFIGGVSAGAISAVHFAYMDKNAEIPSYIDTTKAGLGGGLEGSSGNPGYSTKAIGVVNVCGMLADTAWIEPGDLPCVSLHGDQDVVVPFGTAIISVAGFFQIFEVDGSQSVHARLDEVGINNCFYPMWGAGHVPHTSSIPYQDTTLRVITQFLEPMICGGSTACGYIVANEEAVPTGTLEVWPNPARQTLRVKVPAGYAQDWTWSLTDLLGRKVAGAQVGDSRETVLNRDFPAGVYLLRVRVNEGEWLKKIVFE